ncbi:hypothetical protein, partial [Streptomyces niveiscabiei]|uniref:hypothetical protein n=1 Tax=Streptomyces niveiscabiei TaxID=164115 RepID=UPI001980AA96
MGERPGGFGAWPGTGGIVRQGSGVLGGRLGFGVRQFLDERPEELRVRVEVGVGLGLGPVRLFGERPEGPGLGVRRRQRVLGPALLLTPVLLGAALFLGPVLGPLLLLSPLLLLGPVLLLGPELFGPLLLLSPLLFLGRCCRTGGFGGQGFARRRALGRYLEGLGGGERVGGGAGRGHQRGYRRRGRRYELGKHGGRGIGGAR